MKYKYLFGPVESRRLGLSLGVDLVYHKICNFDCLYCECGKTTQYTQERKEYIPTELIKQECLHFLEHHLDQYPLKSFTLSGAGEPTLASNLGEVIQFLKTTFPQVEVSLITNSSLLWMPEVRKEASLADRILPSLDAVTEKLFRAIDRPDPSLSLEKIIQGCIDLRKEYQGKIDLEIFLTSPAQIKEEEVEKYREVILQIQPDSVQLNSLDRPGTVKTLKPLPYDSLLLFQNRLNLPEGLVQIVKPAPSQELPLSDSFTPEQIEAIQQEAKNISPSEIAEAKEYILRNIMRRPETRQSFVRTTQIPAPVFFEAEKQLLEEGKIIQVQESRGIFLVPTEATHEG